MCYTNKYVHDVDIHVHTHIYMHIYAYMYMYICIMHVYIYIYINIKVQELYIQDSDSWLPWKIEGGVREAEVPEWGETSVLVFVLCNYFMDIYYIINRSIWFCMDQ